MTEGKLDSARLLIGALMGFFIVSSWIFWVFLKRKTNSQIIQNSSKYFIHLEKKKVQAARELGETGRESESEWSRSTLCELIGSHFLLAALSGSGMHTFICLHYTLDIPTRLFPFQDGVDVRTEINRNAGANLILTF